MARAQGSGSAGWMIALLALHFCSLLASSATLTVGGSQGWTIGPDYTTWAAAQTFAVGDVLLFPYTRGAHNVVEVPKASYDACTAANAISTSTTGNTSVTLATAGTHYFLCSFPGHCTAGMALTVTVGGNATAPAPAPSKTNATAPAPAPVSATSPPAPVPSPSSEAAPAPVPAPASTPTPTPSSTPSPAPASSSTPSSAPSPPSASSPPSPAAPSGSTPPNSAAPSVLFSTCLTSVLLTLGGTLLAL